MHLICCWCPRIFIIAFIGIRLRVDILVILILININSRTQYLQIHIRAYFQSLLNVLRSVENEDIISDRSLVQSRNSQFDESKLMMMVLRQYSNISSRAMAKSTINPVLGSFFCEELHQPLGRIVCYQV